MRECRIDRIRLCRTGSDERNSSALLTTNAGSSLNSTLSSMREILSDRSIGRNASTAGRLSRHGQGSTCKKRNNNNAPFYAPSAQEGWRRNNDGSSQPTHPTRLNLSALKSEDSQATLGLQPLR